MNNLRIASRKFITAPNLIPVPEKNLSVQVAKKSRARHER